jgi:membrane protease YdiL (CAAX protease family)
VGIICNLYESATFAVMIQKLGSAALKAIYIILETALYLFFMTLITVILHYGIAFINPFESSSSDLINPYEELLSEYIPLIIASIASLLLVHVVIFKRPLSLTGFVRKAWFRELRLGAVLAWIMLAIGFITLVMFGGIRIDGMDWNTGLFIGFLIMFFIQSSFEEVVSRAFLIPTIERRSNVWLAILGSSLLFSLVHGSNPNVTWLGLTNVFLAGILMGMLFVRYRSIWAPIGLHAAWNFLQGTFFGFEVSGHEVYSVFETTETGNDIITGGAFGFEGSILSVVALFVVSVLVYIGKPSAFHTLSIYSQYDSQILDGNNRSHPFD